MKKQLVEQVMNTLAAAGVEIPFPQRVIYLKKAGKRKKPGAPGTIEPPSPGAGSSPGVNLEELMGD